MRACETQSLENSRKFTLSNWEVEFKSMWESSHPVYFEGRTFSPMSIFYLFQLIFIHGKYLVYTLLFLYADELYSNFIHISPLYLRISIQSQASHILARFFTKVFELKGEMLTLFTWILRIFRTTSNWIGVEDKYWF